MVQDDAGELTAKLGAGNIVAFYGRNLLIGFGVFLIGTVALNAISINFLGNSQGQTLWNLAAMMDAFGGGSGLTKLLLIGSYLGFAVPFFWKDKRSWLLLLLPVVTVAWAFLQISKTGGGPFGGGSVFSFLGIGFYVSAAAAIFIALAGFKRYKAGA